MPMLLIELPYITQCTKKSLASKRGYKSGTRIGSKRGSRRGTRTGFRRGSKRGFKKGSERDPKRGSKRGSKRRSKETFQYHNVEDMFLSRTYYYFNFQIFKYYHVSVCNTSSIVTRVFACDYGNLHFSYAKILLKKRLRDDDQNVPP